MSKTVHVAPKLSKPFERSTLKEHLSVQTDADLQEFYKWVFQYQPGLVKRWNYLRHNIK